VVAAAAARVAVGIARATGRAPLFTPEAVRISRLGLRADCTKAEQRLGMEQSPIDGAVADALRWFAREGYIKSVVLARAILDAPRPSAVEVTDARIEHPSAARANALS
jgi:dihydroflavonol-4-reductase